MNKSIFRSSYINCNAYYNAKNNCLPEHNYLILHYWKPNYKYRYLIKSNLYRENNKIKEESIIRSLTK